MLHKLHNLHSVDDDDLMIKSLRLIIVTIAMRAYCYMQIVFRWSGGWVGAAVGVAEAVNDDGRNVPR